MDAGAHFAALDFADVRHVGGDLRVFADQVRRGFAWVARNAEALGAEPGRLYLAGLSAGDHFAAVALTSDWQADFGLPPDIGRRGPLSELEPVFQSWRTLPRNPGFSRR